MGGGAYEFQKYLIFSGILSGPTICSNKAGKV
jgi:hypothetical protein